MAHGTGCICDGAARYDMRLQSNQKCSSIYGASMSVRIELVKCPNRSFKNVNLKVNTLYHTSIIRSIKACCVSSIIHVTTMSFIIE